MSNLGNRGISLHYISTTLFRREVASIQEKTEKTGGFHSSASETYHRNTEHGLALARRLILRRSKGGQRAEARGLPRVRPARCPAHAGNGREADTASR